MIFIRSLSLALLYLLPIAGFGEPIHLLNVSYDPTREFYQQFNQAFVEQYKTKTGREVVIDALYSHGNLVPEDWQKRLPNNSSPYTSTINFLVRRI
jgi:sulfate/thiosulfate transport system substrate-binding protein